MKYSLQLFFLCSLLFSLGFSPAQSQGQPTSKKFDPFQKIDRAYQQGNITLDQKVLYKFFPSKAKGNLPNNMTLDIDDPLKCGTPATSDFHRHKSELSSSTVNQIESFLTHPTLQAS
ncbi:MAG: hypothetical protein GWN62_02895, partial [Aliifodinibius sp.]|nr:hypothetical protein [Fodinibius sp.]